MEGTILREILRNCSERGDLPVCHWVGWPCEVEETLTYRELGEQSRELAEELLLSLQLQRGDRVVLCYSAGLEFFVSFLACLRAGIIAVPVHPHSTVCDRLSVGVLEHIVKNCSAKCVLTNEHYTKNNPSFIIMMEQVKARTAEVPWHSTAIIAKQDKTQQNPTVPYLDRAKPTDLALLQYTRNRESGDPDGVMHTHSNLLHNLKVLQDCSHSDHGSSAVWPLPLPHRTGLLSHYFLVPFSGGRGYFMSAETLSREPALWLESISKFRPSLAMIPSSTLGLVSALVVPRDTDLSSLSFLGIESGSVTAETVKRTETVKQFIRKFSTRGLNKGVIHEEDDSELAVLSIISDILDEEVEMDTNIWELGCDSLSAVEISGRLERHLGFSVEPHLLFAYQTPRALLKKLKRTLLHLCSPVGATEPISEGGVAQLPLIPSQEDEVAVVGVACRFPGCSSPETLWELVTEKRVCISHFQDPTTGKLIHGGFTKKMANFDREWFSVSEKRASRMDPQQSILLHTVSECLLRSGYTSLDEVRGSRIGVFVGFWGRDARAMSSSSSSIGTTANSISYIFDLKGPSMAVDTPCAASLTALETACCFIHQGKCSEALVGGVNALLNPRVFEVSSKMGVTSLRGESRVFHEGADGYVRGEGCGVVLLKSVREALRQGNRILAVVKSVESLHNATPNKQSQSLLLRRSLSSAMLQQGDISYLEAHGTGTPLGDAMEISAVQEVFGEKCTAREPRVGPLIVGSIKANIGHLEAAAGMAGLIKTVMVLEHAKAPGNAGLHTVNPAMNVNPHTILLPRETVSLDTHFTCGPQSSNLLSAGVSSFGIGGSIASAILQQFSQLPHLGQVHCSLILDGDLGNLSTGQLMAAIQLLRARLCSFNSAYLSCVEAFQRAKPRVLAEAYDPAYLTFCLLYSVAKTVQAHDPELSFVMGTTLCAEVVVLAVADVLILSDAILLLAGMAPQVFKDKEMQPTMSFLSPTLNRHFFPGRFPRPPPPLKRLIHVIQRKPHMKLTCNDPAKMTSYLSVARRYGSLLVVTFNPNSSVVGRDPGNEDTILQLQSSGLLDHFRESFISLRLHSDRITHSKTQFPSDKAKMPNFYKRYPMRAALRDVSQAKKDTLVTGRVVKTRVQRRKTDKLCCK